MSQVPDLIAVLALAAVVGLWFKSARARERAIDEARRQCAQHGLQLLDETVGLCGLRLGRVDGRRRLEVGYGFEVSAHGDDRQEGQLWLHGGVLVSVSLPGSDKPLSDEAGPSAGTGDLQPTERQGNVIPLRPRQPHTGR